MALEHPPLACRPSPPQGGRSDCRIAFANHQHRSLVATKKLPISPLEGEMPGRAEGRASR
ncbi:MAG: propionyl-coenzyme A carboxylase alpha polypeptide [Mesorhizobium sp.]|nr:MAG: propionyl-coenzyme A carboxylase alpha polypeptide [Mesorhizobium sp.]TJU95228.1 MAG: propionyl-coenzyme A carboxylase alpha polypeptide [Mesorhizobium sp.]TJV17268.1 MAG: propionyl-coenzyme A carboxylase alpha polypeptide [Mesorhizobium sp.]